MHGFDPRVLFRAITERAFIEERDIRRFLKRLGHQPSKQELLNIMRRFDLTGSNSIGYEEFCEALLPISTTPNQHTPRGSPDGTKYGYHNPLGSPKLHVVESKDRLAPLRDSYDYDSPNYREKMSKKSSRKTIEQYNAYHEEKRQMKKESSLKKIQHSPEISPPKNVTFDQVGVYPPAEPILEDKGPQPRS